MELTDAGVRQKTSDDSGRAMRITPPPQAEFWIMPDLIGSSLAEAEDAIRFVTDSSSGVRTTSIDATGRARNDPTGAEWRVCWQAPDGGDWISPGSLVSFYVAMGAELSSSSTGSAETVSSIPALQRQIHPQSDD